MSIQSEIERITSNVQSSLSICADNGVEVAEGANSDDLPDAVEKLAAKSGGSGNITFATEEPGEADGNEGELRLVYTPYVEPDMSGEGYFKIEGKWYRLMPPALTAAEIRAICS